MLRCYNLIGTVFDIAALMLTSGASEPKSSSRVRGQRLQKEERKEQPATIPPDFADVAYGPHERNVLDLWQTESASPTPVLVYFHGGGFSHGNKTVAASMVRLCRAAGISLSRRQLPAFAPSPLSGSDA